MLTKEQIEEYFKSDKTDWVKINSYGEKEWDEKKVNLFWERIRIYKIDVNDYEFNGYIFPEFQPIRYTEKKNPLERDRNFWRKGQDFEFHNMIYFDNCTFLGYANFTFVKFYNVVRFTRVEFKGETSFNFTKFYKSSSFSRSTFFNTGFFYKTVFEEECFFYKTKFKAEINFIETVFYETVFKRVHFGDNEVLFENLRNERFPSIIFIDLRFNSNVIFRNSEMNTLSFIKSDLNDTIFSNCVWTKNNRIKLIAEEYLNDEMIFPDGDRVTLEGLEETYRQIKRNFESNKNWEQSGYAYVSEMEMRKKRLWQEKKFASWLIYWFYSYFGGYTQSFTKPLFLLTISTLIIFPFLYYTTECFNYTFYINFDNEPEFDMLYNTNHCGNYFQKSIEATFIFFKSNLYYKHWGLKYLQTLFSTILLTFFILGLRQRFKH